jgi:hypothetical protein
LAAARTLKFIFWRKLDSTINFDVEEGSTAVSSVRIVEDDVDEVDGEAEDDDQPSNGGSSAVFDLAAVKTKLLVFDFIVTVLLKLSRNNYSSVGRLRIFLNSVF